MYLEGNFFNGQRERKTLFRNQTESDQKKETNTKDVWRATCSLILSSQRRTNTGARGQDVSSAFCSSAAGQPALFAAAT